MSFAVKFPFPPNVEKIVTDWMDGMKRLPEYFGRHCADNWTGPGWPILIYRTWLPGDENRPPRHAKPEMLMLTTGPKIIINLTPLQQDDPATDSAEIEWWFGDYRLNLVLHKRPVGFYCPLHPKRPR